RAIREVGPRQVRGDHPGRRLIALDERRVRRAARQRLDAGRATPREEVKESCARQVRLEDGEQGLLDTIADGTRARARRLEPEAPGGPGDDPARVSHRQTP